MRALSNISTAFVLALMPAVVASGAASGGGLALQKLHEFPSTPHAPFWGPMQAVDGSLYGTAMERGATEPSTIFKLTTNGVLTTLFSLPTNNPGVSGTRGVLVQHSDGNLYGTALGFADPQRDSGTLFKLTTNGILTLLHSFQRMCPQEK